MSISCSRAAVNAGRPPPPPPPPPVQAHDDLETAVPLTPEQALDGTYVEVELSDGTTVEVQTPPEAGDGWRLRLEGVAPGGRDHFLQLQVRTDEGLRVDGLRVLYRLDLPAPEGAWAAAPWFPPSRALFVCAFRPAPPADVCCACAAKA